MWGIEKGRECGVLKRGGSVGYSKGEGVWGIQKGRG